MRVQLTAAHAPMLGCGVSKGAYREASTNILGHAQVLVVVNLKGEIGARTARQRPQAGRGSECLAWSPGEGRCPRSVGQTHPKNGSRMGTRTSCLSRPSAGWRLLSSAQQMTFFKTRLRKKNEPL